MEKLPKDLVKLPKDLEPLREVFGMPPRPHKLFWMYVAMGSGKRSLSKLAEEAGEKLSAIKGWHERYHWNLNAQKHDTIIGIGLATTFSGAIRATKMRSTIAVMKFVESGNQAMMSGNFAPNSFGEYVLGLEVLDKLSASSESQPADGMLDDFTEDADFVEVLEMVGEIGSIDEAEEVDDGG